MSLHKGNLQPGKIQRGGEESKILNLFYDQKKKKRERVGVKKNKNNRIQLVNYKLIMVVIGS